MSSCDTCLGNNLNPGGYGCGKIPQRIITQADVIAFAQRGGASDKNQLCFSQACLMTGRVLYWKNNPGDCPTESRISLGPAAGISKGLGVASTGIAAASSVSLLATGGAGIGASAGGSGALLGGLPAVIGATAGIAALVAIPLAIWATISAHHKIAVAKEQATLCDVSQAFNQWADTVEFGIAAGQVAVMDAKNAVPIMEQQLMQACQAIRQECNAACYVAKAIKSLNLYAVEKLFDSLSPRATPNNPANISQPVVMTKKSNEIWILAGAGALGAAKLAGAFA